MVGIQTNTTLVGRLRIRSRSSDPQAEQQRIERMLRSATLHPSGLPESATLVVRRLADPLPSRLRAGPYDLLPDASWQRAVMASLEKLAASAARPAYGAVPAETDAVLFYDRAEVLAALALDWMGGTLPIQWWWREFLRGRDAVTTLLREWTESPQYVPGALDLLAKRARAVQFVRRMPQQVASEILATVLIAFNVPRPGTEDRPLQKIAEDRSEAQQPTAETPKTKTASHAMVRHAPFRRWVPEADTPVLLPAQSMLLIQALMLRRAPAVARTAAFQKDLLRWQAAVESLTAIEDLETQEVQEERPHRATQEEPAELEMPMMSAGQGRAAGPATVVPLASPAPEHPAEKAVAAERVMATSSGTDNAPLHSTAPPSQEPAITSGSTGFQEPLQLRRTDDQTPALAQEPASKFPTTSNEAQLERANEPATILETEYGGVFFLLSLALYLYIYGDFTSPAEPGLELNIWDFLALMAFELTDGDIEKDPLWAELAVLGGRPKSVRPGLGFDPPDEWRVPAEWLAAFAEGCGPQPALINGRMISMHPAGFTVIDVPPETDVMGDARESSRTVNRLQRWVGWMAGYFRARLVRALGREDAVALLCQRPARLTLTLTHVDLTFALEHHPIELRMAGLDRDLGWIPAAGRYVAFHFE
jgi:hypothetical protein